MSSVTIHDNPTLGERMEIRKSILKLSEWLNLVAKEWCTQPSNTCILESMDDKLQEYKPYTHGLLSSQMLCRLSCSVVPVEAGAGVGSAGVSDVSGASSLKVGGDALNGNDTNTTTNANANATTTTSISNTSTDSIDFWSKMGIQDEFDKAYLMSQIERFNTIYSIRSGGFHDEMMTIWANGNAVMNTDQMANAWTANSMGLGGMMPSTAMNAAMPWVNAGGTFVGSPNTFGNTPAAVHDSAARDDKRQKKVDGRKDAANGVAYHSPTNYIFNTSNNPVELDQSPAHAHTTHPPKPGINTNQVVETAQKNMSKKPRSKVIISYASDLDSIVKQGNELWNKYNGGDESNGTGSGTGAGTGTGGGSGGKDGTQKVSWASIAKELGIHVKVREKYYRMHARAVHRGFDFEKFGHWKIKDHPKIFNDPIEPGSKPKAVGSVSEATATGTATAPMQPNDATTEDDDVNISEERVAAATVDAVMR